MKQILAAGVANLCVLVVLAAWPSPTAAGGGHGYHGGFRHHFGFRHHGYGHHGPWPFRRFGHYRHGPYHGHGPNHGHRYRPRGYYESPWDDDEPPVYAEPPVYSEPRVYAEPEISSEPLPPVSASETCRQVREYQTQIYVGGKPVQAYGQACLQPDGAWSYGVPSVRAD